MQAIKATTNTITTRTEATALSVDCPDELQLKIFDDLTPDDLCSVYLTDKVNNQRVSRLLLSSQLEPGLMSSFFSSFIQPLIQLVVPQRRSPKEIALTSPSRGGHLLSWTRQGMKFLALHKIDNPLTIHRLDAKTSTVEEEIEKRVAAEEEVNRFLEKNDAEWRNDLFAHLGPLRQFRELMIRLIANGLMTKGQLQTFNHTSYNYLSRAVNGYERAILKGLITAEEVVAAHNKQQISSEVIQDAIINNQITREVGLTLGFSEQLALTEERLQNDINSERPRKEAIEFAVNNLPADKIYLSCSNYFERSGIEITNDNWHDVIGSLLFDLSTEALDDAKTREPLTGDALVQRARKFGEKLKNL